MDTLNVGHVIIGVGVGIIAAGYPCVLIRRAGIWLERRLFGEAS